jgi:hypothetical protein
LFTTLRGVSLCFLFTTGFAGPGLLEFSRSGQGRFAVSAFVFCLRRFAVSALFFCLRQALPARGFWSFHDPAMIGRHAGGPREGGSDTAKPPRWRSVTSAGA